MSSHIDLVHISNLKLNRLPHHQQWSSDLCIQSPTFHCSDYLIPKSHDVCHLYYRISKVSPLMGERNRQLHSICQIPMEEDYFHPSILMWLPYYSTIVQSLSLISSFSDNNSNWWESCWSISCIPVAMHSSIFSPCFLNGHMHIDWQQLNANPSLHQSMPTNHLPVDLTNTTHRWAPITNLYTTWSLGTGLFSPNISLYIH